VGGEDKLEAFLVGAAAAIGVSFAVFFWFLLVRPSLLMSVFSDSIVSDESWEDQSPFSLLLLRVMAGLILFVFGFFTGLTLSFLSSTAA
jgi:hypothetical protein